MEISIHNTTAIEIQKTPEKHTCEDGREFFVLHLKVFNSDGEAVYLSLFAPRAEALKIMKVKQ